MRFELRHALPRSPEVAWAAMFGEKYEAAVSESGSLTRVVLDEGPRGALFFRRTRITSAQKLPGAMAAAIGQDQLTYVLEETRNDAGFTLDWRVIPAVMADKVKAAGTYTLVPAAGGCERLVRGEIVVSIPLLGGKIEKGIGDELQASYERSAAFARNWLLENT